MNRARIFPILAPLLLFLACDAPPTALDSNSDTDNRGATDPLQVSADDLPGLWGPFPIAYPFMPYPDGYGFKNYGGAGDWDLYSETFGGHVHLWSLPDVSYFNNTFLPLYGNGVCFGFAVTASMFHRGLFGPDQVDFFSEAAGTWDIPQVSRGKGGLVLDEAIEHHIGEYFFYQASPHIWSHRFGNYRPDKSWYLIDRVEAAQDAGWEDEWVLGFWGPWGGHAVNILNVKREGDGATFTVYDNNAPFNSTTNTPGFREFQMSPDGYVYGTKEVTKAAIIAVSHLERDHIDKWWGDPSFADFYVLMSRVLDPEVVVVHTDEFGRRLGRTATAEFDQIPDAGEFIPLTGGLTEGWVPPVQYYLPLGDYTVDLLNSTTGNLAYQLYAGDAVFTLAATGAGSARARVSNVVADRTFAFVTREPVQGFQAQLVQVINAEEERALQVAGLPLPADGALRITPTMDAGGFAVAFEGAEAALCDLSLTLASPAGVISQPLPAIQLVEGASLVVEPWDWDRLTQMPIFSRTVMPDGTSLLRAFNSTATNLNELLEDLLASGAIPNRGIANSISKQVENAPGRALVNHLESLVSNGVIAGETADLILATAEAAGVGT